MKYISLLAFIVFFLTSCGYRIKQKTTKYLELGYNVETVIWKDLNIVWSHYTFQEWESRNYKSYIPLDSVPSVRARDYETAKKMVALFKAAKY